jgi:hypothetical protein
MFLTRKAPGHVSLVNSLHGAADADAEAADAEVAVDADADLPLEAAEAAEVAEAVEVAEVAVGAGDVEAPAAHLLTRDNARRIAANIAKRLRQT